MKPQTVRETANRNYIPPIMAPYHMTGQEMVLYRKYYLPSAKTWGDVVMEYGTPEMKREIEKYRLSTRHRGPNGHVND